MKILFHLQRLAQLRRPRFTPQHHSDTHSSPHDPRSFHTCTQAQRRLVRLAQLSHISSTRSRGRSTHHHQKLDRGHETISQVMMGPGGTHTALAALCALLLALPTSAQGPFLYYRFDQPAGTTSVTVSAQGLRRRRRRRRGQGLLDKALG